MKTTSILFLAILCFLGNFMLAQNFIPYYPIEWDFRNQVDLIDFSQVKSLTTKELKMEQTEEIPVSEIYLKWNNTYQLTDYQFVNYNSSYSDFDIKFNYADAHSQKLKSVQIINPNTLKIIEDWQYTYGAFDVEKIKVNRFLDTKPEPKVFEVKYEGNDDDYTQEKITSGNSAENKSEFWYKSNKDGTTLRLSKKHFGGKFTETDSLILDKNDKALERKVANFGADRYTKYIYKSRKVNVAGDQFDYRDLELIQRDGKDSERFEYQFDKKGNWTERKTYEMKAGKWQVTQMTKREIEYRN
ncbi:hypothetical protein [Chryseobacterium echinoideorum]|uniref:hypothetical protein n=1 Tax=Chryseobacterium echinoideorum TaxID=1549648 RepID=UPI001185F124|nr:hypothetical protein [Chryseobacterium echinoideorum]